jgi:hypothetical protein
VIAPGHGQEGIMSFGEFLWSILIFYLIFVYFMMLFRVIMDVFRRDDLSGWGKAGWFLLLLIFPLLGVLIYVIAYGGSMVRRDVAGAQQAQVAQDAYIRQVAGSTPDPATQIAKAKDLADSGAITAQEFESIKAKALA